MTVHYFSWTTVLVVLVVHGTLHTVQYINGMIIIDSNQQSMLKPGAAQTVKPCLGLPHTVLYCTYSTTVHTDDLHWTKLYQIAYQPVDVDVSPTRPSLTNRQ